MDVFGSKKTYQALKGCYERNFNLFKQIYAFEQFHVPNNNLSHLSEADRLREYERRLAAARKAGCDVGNITARTIEHWHRRGWYDLFYRRYVTCGFAWCRIYAPHRWHGDPATTRPSQSRNNNNTNSNQGGPPDDPDQDDDHHQPSQPPPPPQPHHQQQQQQAQQPQHHQHQQPTNTNTSAGTNTATSTGGLDFTTENALTNGINGFTPHLNYINPQSLRDNPLVPPSPATVPTGPNSSSLHTGAAMGGGTGAGGTTSSLGGASTSMTNGNLSTTSTGATSSSHPHLSNVIHTGGLGGSGSGSHTSLGSSHQSGLGGPTSSTSTSGTSGAVGSSSATSTGSTTGSPNDQPVVNITITQNMLSTYLQFLQVQTQTGKMKLEYLRRREEREEKESVQRREMERMKLEREAAEFEHSKHSANTKQKADRAIVGVPLSLYLFSRAHCLYRNCSATHLSTLRSNTPQANF